MGKYVCDFAKVNAEAENIIQAGADMNAAINTYSTNVSQNLSGWSGPAKEAFDVTHDEEVNTAETNANDVEELGTFIKDSCNKIQTLESDLASMKI